MRRRSAVAAELAIVFECSQGRGSVRYPVLIVYHGHVNNATAAIQVTSCTLGESENDGRRDVKNGSS